MGKRGEMEEEILHRIREGKKMLGGLREVWSKDQLTRMIKTRMFECMVVPTVLYGCGSWAVNAGINKKMNVLEMIGLRTIYGVSRRDRIRNERLKLMCNWKRGLVRRSEQGILKWFGHIVRTDNERVVKKVFDSCVAGERGRERPKWRWMDGVKELLRMKGFSVEQGEKMAVDRGVLRRIVWSGLPIV